MKKLRHLINLDDSTSTAILLELGPWSLAVLFSQVLFGKVMGDGCILLPYPFKAHGPQRDASFLNLRLHLTWRNLFVSRILVKIENRYNFCSMSFRLMRMIVSYTVERAFSS